MFPGDPCVQDEQDALEHQPVRMPLAPRVPGPTLRLGQQRLHHCPQLVVDLPRLRPSHPTPPDHQFRTDPTTSKIISLGALRRRFLWWAAVRVPPGRGVWDYLCRGHQPKGSCRVGGLGVYVPSNDFGTSPHSRDPFSLSYPRWPRLRSSGSNSAVTTCGRVPRTQRRLSGAGSYAVRTDDFGFRTMSPTAASGSAVAVRSRLATSWKP
jgi:hypothetical protein